MSKHDFHRNFAIIIGINNYQNSIRELKSAVPDALKLAEIIQKQHENLKPQYQGENKYEVQLLLNQRASLSQLKQLIADFKQGEITLDKKKVTITESDRLLFYFAGHGIALDALENQEGPVGYLIPQDAISGDSSTYLPMQELHDALNALPCRHMLAILDCCFAGAFRWASVKREVVRKVQIYKERYDRFISDRAWQVITSASDDQKALDSLVGSRGRVTDGNEVHSPFAQALFDALLGKGADSNQDGMVTATELYSYLRDQVEIASENYYQRQTPSLCPLRKHDKGEFIFLLPDFDRDKLEDAPPLNVKNNPYRGLSSYDEKDSNLFFGREDQIQKLYQKVVDNKQQLTLVLGASGTGKSSLVKAGLIPKLRKDDKTWRILPPFRPGESPLKSLNNVLESVKQPLIQAGTSSHLFTPAEESLGNWFKNNPQAKLLVIIDQFEELITLSKSEEAEKFQIFIKNIVAKYPNNIHVVITLRLDFEAQFQTSVLKDFWNDDARFVVSPMSQNEFREAIEKPASQKVIYFDPPSLVDELINEVVQMPGALPLLSFTLSELYLKYLGDRTRDNRALTKKDYEELGRVVGSLTKRANQEYEKLVAEDSAYQDTVRRVMLRMISLQGGELARRQVPKSELIYTDEKETERVNTVIKSFSEARLIIEGSNPQSEPYVEPAHDALVMGWGRIRNWLNERQAKVKTVSQWHQLKTWFNVRLLEGDSNKVTRPEAEQALKVNLSLQREVTNAANNWSRKRESDRDKQAVGFLWDRDPRLPQLEQIQQSDDNWFNKTETQFVEHSITQKRRNIRNFWIAVVLAFAGVTSFALYFWWQLQQSQLREKITRSENLLATDPLASLVIAIDAIGRNRNTPIVNVNILPEVRYSLLSAVQTSRERNRFSDNVQGKAIALSPDGEKIASADGNGNVYLWDLQGKQQWKRNVTTPLGNIKFLEFSPDGKILIATSDQYNSSAENNTPNPVQFWDLQGNQIQPLGASGTAIITATFSPNGRLIVGGGSDGAIYWRDLQGDSSVKSRQVSSDRSAIHAVAFSPDGRTIVSADEKGCIYLWQLQGNQLNKVACDDSLKNIRSIALNKNGNRILINLVPDYSESGFSYESFAILWNLDNQEQQWKRSFLKVANPGFSSRVLFAAFSPDSSTIVTGGEDGSVRLWDSECKEISQPLLGHSSNVESVAFSSDGKRIISNSSDGSIRLWDAEQNLSEQRISRYGESRSTILSPDGQKVAIGGEIINDQGKSELKGSVTLLDIIAGNRQIFAGTNMQEQSSGQDQNGEPLAVSSKGYVLVKTVDNLDDGKSRLILWHPGATSEKQTIGTPETNFGHIAAISPDSQMIASTVDEGGVTDAIGLWDIQGNPIGQPMKNDENFSVQSIAFSPDGQQIVSGSSNYALNGASSQSSVCLLHLKVDGLEKKPCQLVTGELNKVAFSPDSKTVAIGQSDGGLYLWNLQTNVIGKRFGGNGQPVLSIAFSPDSKILASGSRDGSMRLWNLNGNPIGRAFQSYTSPNKAVSSIAFSQDGKTVIVAYIDGSVRFWQADLELLLQVACNRLRDHSILKNPSNEEERGAKKTCETYVWNTKI